MEKIEPKINKPRVRIAPSPTGLFHIGTARAALFNYLFAKKYDGVFILRIEDTDAERSKKEYEEDIIQGLKWLGLLWDEGPSYKNSESYIGDYGPYRQSERRELYKKYIERLLQEDKAYYCFCSKEELEAKRQYQMSMGLPPRYDGTCRNLSKEQVEQNLRQGKPSVIRFKMPAKKVVFNDLIRGKIEIDSSIFGDIVIAKDLYHPLYNLAAVIDDFEMKITHIIRGEDHISNTPKQILLQEALGFPQPQYAHLPLILGPDRTKLSKRHGAVSISEYKKLGYLPEAMINFMAFMGWNPDSEREIYSLPSLIKEFSLEKCQKSSSIFNLKKLTWINGFYIRQKSIQKLTELCLPYLIQAGLIIPKLESTEGYPPGSALKTITTKYFAPAIKEEINFDYLEKIISIYQERLKILSEIPDLVDFFFKDKLSYDKELLRWKNMNFSEIKEVLSRLKYIITNIKEKDFSKENLQKILIEEAERIKKGDRGYLLWPFRVALTGKKASASPFDIAQILGKEKTLKRIDEALSLLS